MVSTLFRDPQALSSDLASLGTLQPRAFGSLNRVETLDSASNYYIAGTGCLYSIAVTIEQTTREPHGQHKHNMIYNINLCSKRASL